MISERFLKLFSIVVKIGNKFGSFAFTFDPVHIKASRSSNPKLVRNVYLNQLFCVVGIVSCFAILAKAYIFGNFSDLILKLLFASGFLMMLLVYFFAQYYLDDLIILANSSFKLLHHLHGKKSSFKEIPLYF